MARDFLASIRTHSCDGLQAVDPLLPVRDQGSAAATKEVGAVWARKNEAGVYEIRTVTKKGEGYSYPGGVFSKEAFERYYEKAD
jgi:hypothetical protein